MSYYLDENENIVDKASADWAIANGKLDLANLTTITSAKAEEIKAAKKEAVTSQPKFLAAEAQAYLTSTDWIEAKYVREVVRNKSMTEEEFNLKYSVELDNREDAISVISDYQDSL